MRYDIAINKLIRDAYFGKSIEVLGAELRFVTSALILFKIMIDFSLIYKKRSLYMSL